MSDKLFKIKTFPVKVAIFDALTATIEIGLIVSKD